MVKLEKQTFFSSSFSFPKKKKKNQLNTRNVTNSLYKIKESNSFIFFMNNAFVSKKKKKKENEFIKVEQKVFYLSSTLD